MNTYYCQDGQSLTDVCLMTYGTLDKYAKLLNDNGLSPEDAPYSAQPILWGDEEATVTTTITVPEIAPTVYATSAVPEQKKVTLTNREPYTYWENGNGTNTYTNAFMADKEIVFISTDGRIREPNVDYTFSASSGITTFASIVKPTQKICYCYK